MQSLNTPAAWLTLELMDCLPLRIPEDAPVTTPEIFRITAHFWQADAGGITQGIQRRGSDG